MRLRRRSTPEMMDDFTIQDDRIDRSLTELRIINRYLGGSGTTREGLQLVQKRERNVGPFTILDAGSGGADVFDPGQHYDIVALDRNPRACSYLQRNSQTTIVCGDVLNWPLKEQSVDIVHASLFLHHFNECEIQRLLTSFAQTARHTIILNDLRRSVFAYVGIWSLTRLFSRSTMVKNDGPLSVLRGFSQQELMRMLDKGGFKHFIIRRTWAFRWLVVIDLDNHHQSTQ